MKGCSLHNRAAEHCGPIELTSAHATNCLRSGFEVEISPTMAGAAFQPSKKDLKGTQEAAALATA